MSKQMAERQAALMEALDAWRAAMTPEAALAEVEKVQAAGRAWAQEYAARRAAARVRAAAALKADAAALKVGRGK